MSRYCPAVTSVRIVLNSPRAARPALRVAGDRDPEVDEFVAPPEQQVTEQERRRGSEAVGRTVPAPFAVQEGEGSVHARLTATLIGVVHDVVVNEGGGVEDLEACRNRDDGGEVGIRSALSSGSNSVACALTARQPQ